MQLVQIWKCQCGSKRVWGNAAQPDILSNPVPLLNCERSCSRKPTQHVFDQMETREWTGTRWVKSTNRDVM